MEAIRTAVAAQLDQVPAIQGRSGNRQGIVARACVLARMLLRRQLRLFRRHRRLTATREVLESLDDRMLKDIGLRRMELHSAVSRLYEPRL